MSSLNADTLKYYLPWVLITATIVLVSWYYLTYYNGYGGLPCNTSINCVIAYSTSIFNGYTETVSLHFGIGGNVYENVLYAALALFAFFAIAAYLNMKKYVKPILASMLISQYLFAIIYPLIILPAINKTALFGGGLSLFDLFSLISILFFIIKDLMQKRYASRLFKGQADYIIGVIFPIFVLFVPMYFFLGLGNSIVNYTSLAIIVLALPLVGFVIVTIGIISTAKRVIRSTFQTEDNGHKNRIILDYTLHIMSTSVVVAIFGYSYLIPFLLTSNGYVFGYVNSHNFGWPIFLVLTYCLWKKKALGFGN